jgi:hypothetical protein
MHEHPGLAPSLYAVEVGNGECTYLYGVVSVGIGGSPSPLTLRALLQEYLQSVVSILALVLW